MDDPKFCRRLKIVFLAAAIVALSSCVAPQGSPIQLALKAENQSLRDKINSDNQTIEQLEADLALANVEIDQLDAELALANIKIGHLETTTNAGMFSGGAPYLLVVCLGLMGIVWWSLRRAGNWQAAFESLSQAIENRAVEAREQKAYTNIREIKKQFAYCIQQRGLKKMVDSNLRRRQILGGAPKNERKAPERKRNDL